MPQLLRQALKFRFRRHDPGYRKLLSPFFLDKLIAALEGVLLEVAVRQTIADPVQATEGLEIDLRKF